MNTQDWPERSFQLTAHMGSANPESIEALRWAAMEEDKITAAAVVQQIFKDSESSVVFRLGTLVQRERLGDGEEHQSQQCGLEAWRGLNATHDSSNKGRRRVRMQYWLQPKRS